MTTILINEKSKNFFFKVLSCYFSLVLISIKEVTEILVFRYLAQLQAIHFPLYAWNNSHILLMCLSVFDHVFGYVLDFFEAQPFHIDWMMGVALASEVADNPGTSLPVVFNAFLPHVWHFIIKFIRFITTFAWVITRVEDDDSRLNNFPYRSFLSLLQVVIVWLLFETNLYLSGCQLFKCVNDCFCPFLQEVLFILLQSDFPHGCSIQPDSCSIADYDSWKQ